MATFRSYLDMLNRSNDIGRFSSNAMREVSITAERMVGFSPQIHETYQSMAKIGAQISPPILDAIQNAQRLSQLISPDVYKTARIGMEFANAVSIQLDTIANSLYRIGFDLQPQLNELSRIAPTLQQIANLHQRVTTLVEDIEFSNDIPEEISFLNSEDKQKASRAVSEILSKPETWEHALIRVINVMKESHPVLVRAILYLLTTILTIACGVLSNIIYNTIKPSTLREAPSTNSRGIMVIAPSQQVILLDEVPYYFEIEYTDPQNGETYIGWVTKRSIQERETIEGDATEIKFQEGPTAPHVQPEGQATASSIETGLNGPEPPKIGSADKIK